MTRVLVTGSHGFLSRSLAQVAARRGWPVLGLGRPAQSSRNWPGKYETLDLIEGDLVRTLDAFRPDVVFHGAGTASVAHSFESPIADLQASVGTFARVLDAARHSTIRPLVIFPSSAAVFGNPPPGAIDETTTLAPISPYGHHKAMCEALAREYRECFGVSSLIVRVFSTFGPLQRRLLLWEIYDQALRSEQVTLRGTGEEIRDHLYVEDLCESICDIAILDTPPAVLNVASGRSTTTREVARLVLDALELTKPVVCLGEVSRGDPGAWHANVSRLRALSPRAAPSLETRIRDCTRSWSKD